MRRVRISAVLAAALVLLPGMGAAQNDERPQNDAAVAERPLATRAELEALAGRLRARGDGASALLARVRERLTEGDFRRGDRIALQVQAESTLTDTFTVSAEQELLLPPPTVGTLSLRGVLRSELQDKMAAYIARFRQNPVVRAYPLIRLSVQGEVSKGGIYAVAADATLADVVMAAGGTTEYAKTRELRIERNGKRVWEGSSFEVAIDDLALRNGDQIFIGSSRPGRMNENLRFVALLVSIAGGLYGLTRIF